MKKYFLLAAIVVAMMVTGILQFQKTGDEVNISIDRQKLRKVSGELMEEGRELIDGARHTIDAKRNQPSDFGEAVEQEFQTQTRRFTPSRNQ